MTGTGGTPDVVVVDGAEGFLGSAVAEALVGQGWNVRALVSDADSAKVPEGVEVFAAPLGDSLPCRADHGVDQTADQKKLAEAIRGARAVVAARRIERELPREGLTFRRVHAEHTVKLLAAAEAAGVARFIYAGVAGVDGDSHSPLADAEREVKAHLIASKLPTLYLNLPIVVGPGDGTVSCMARKARSLWPVISFAGQGWTRAAPLTREDFGACVVALLGTDDFPTGELDLAGPEALTVMDIQDRLLRSAGRCKVKLHVVESVARLGSWLAERAFAVWPRGSPLAAVPRIAWMFEERIPKRSAATKLLGRKPDEFEKAFFP